MTTTDNDLQAIEEDALAHLTAEEGIVEADIEAAGDDLPEDEALETAEQPVRLAVDT